MFRTLSVVRVGDAPRFLYTRYEILIRAVHSHGFSVYPRCNEKSCEYLVRCSCGARCSHAAVSLSQHFYVQVRSRWDWVVKILGAPETGPPPPSSNPCFLRLLIRSFLYGVSLLSRSEGIPANCRNLAPANYNLDFTSELHNRVTALLLSPLAPCLPPSLYPPGHREAS